MRSGKAWKQILISLAVTLVIWAVFSWPLPRHAASAIPSSAYNVEKGSMRMMIPGDHLQMLYQLWIAADTFKGGTPWFHDVYEFNTGNDEDRYFLSTYYLPLSLFYAAGEKMTGTQAGGYNFTAFITLWLTYLFTWLLVRRYTKEDWLSAIAAMVGIIFPYRWITMLDGSPTGLAMMWVPVIFYGLDVMVAEKKIWAGALAGFGLFVSEWGDTHVFFFSVLSSPFWCLFSWLFHSPRWPSKKDILSVLKASVFLIFFMGLVVFQGLRVRHGLKGSELAGKGRSFTEVANCSLPLSGVLKFKNPDDSRKIYIGIYLLALLAAGGWAASRSRVLRADQPAVYPAMALLLLALGIFGIVMLSAGTRNPLGPKAWKLLTMVVPPYGMIRQADKIYCLMPVFLAVGCALFWRYILELAPAGRRRLVTVALLVPLLFDYSYRIKATICGLEQEQGAYRAVAEDAHAAGNKRPHIMVLPIWPGVSHYNSVNDYYVSLYHIRMVNGYGGTVKKKYMEDFFAPMESINMGGIYDSQLDELLKRGIGYLVLHEDVFPEKVSPFPVGYTLQKLVNHPRLECIGKDGAAWAFKILPLSASRTGAQKQEFITHVFPSRRRELERSVITNAVVCTNDQTALGDGYVKMAVTGGRVLIPTNAAPLDSQLYWLIRTRGEGALSLSHLLDGATNGSEVLNVKSAEWAWQKVNLPCKPASLPVAGELSLVNGNADVDSAMLCAGEWKGPAKGETMTLPAACFFHAGYIEKDFGSVVLRKLYEPDNIAFYGPKLPLEKGRYSAEIVFESGVPAGTVLGGFNVRWRDRDTDNSVPVTVGSRAVTVFEQKDNKPFFVAFRFVREADVKICRVIITRLE